MLIVRKCFLRITIGCEGNPSTSAPCGSHGSEGDELYGLYLSNIYQLRQKKKKFQSTLETITIIDRLIKLAVYLVKQKGTTNRHFDIVNRLYLLHVLFLWPLENYSPSLNGRSFQVDIAPYWNRSSSTPGHVFND